MISWRTVYIKLAGLWTLYCHSYAVADINARLGESCCVTYCIPGGVAAVRTRVQTLGGIMVSISSKDKFTF